MKAPKSVPLRYALALAVFALILFLSTALDRLFSVKFDPTSLIILWMIGASWYLGIGPGLVVAVCFELTLQSFSPAAQTFSHLFSKGFVKPIRQPLASMVVWDWVSPSCATLRNYTAAQRRHTVKVKAKVRFFA